MCFFGFHCHIFVCMFSCLSCFYLSYTLPICGLFYLVLLASTLSRYSLFCADGTLNPFHSLTHSRLHHQCSMTSPAGNSRLHHQCSMTSSAESSRLHHQYSMTSPAGNSCLHHQCSVMSSAGNSRLQRQLCPLLGIPLCVINDVISSSILFSLYDNYFRSVWCIFGSLFLQAYLEVVD